MFSVLHLIWISPRWRGDWMRMKIGSNKGSIPDVRRFKKETLINDIHNIMSRTIVIEVGIDILPALFCARTQWECAHVFLFFITYYIFITYYLLFN